MTAAAQLSLDLESPLPPYRARNEGAYAVYVADGTEEGVGSGPLPVLADDVREAEQVAATLAGVEPDRCLALPVREGDWSTELMSLLDGANRRAEDELQELRAITAKILGIPLEELDARVAADEANAHAERDKIKAARRQPLPKKEKRSPGRAGSSAGPAGVHAPEPSGDRGGPSAPSALPMRRLTELQRDLLRGFEVAGNVARYTSTEHQPDWAQVKAVFVALGGNWRTGGKKKVGGFHFPDDADGVELVRLALATGEILDPKLAGYFPTPSELADRIVALAELRPNDRVLEPSAGRGALALAVRRACPTARINCVELLPDNRAELERLGFTLVGDDFLKLDPVDRPENDPERLGWHDLVIANPPFGDRADIAHVRHAFRFLNPTGGLVSIMSAGVLYRDDTLARDFRSFVAAADGRFEENPPGSFLESGTAVKTVTLVVPRKAQA